MAKKNKRDSQIITRRDDYLHIPWLQKVFNGPELGTSTIGRMTIPVETLQDVIFNNLYQQLTEYTMSNGYPVYEKIFYELKVAKGGVVNETFLKGLVEKFNLTLIFNKQKRDASDTSSYYYANVLVYVSDVGIVEITVSGDNCCVELVNFSLKRHHDMIDYVEANITDVKLKSSFSMVMVQGNSIDFEDLDIDILEFNPKNYSTAVVDQYDNILKQLNAPGNGKLLIMQGPPGTGKSSLIRGLLHDLKDESSFIFLPTNMLTQIVTPSFLPALIRESKSDKSIVLIIEDADDSLIERATDNLGVISTLLNMTSGLLGDSLNLRVIATTNMRKSDIDPALTRSGRLFDLMEFEALDSDQAKELYKSLGGKEEYNGSGILADIYQSVRLEGKGAKSETTSVDSGRKVKRKVGFC